MRDYYLRNKKSLLWLLIGLVTILVTSFCQMMVQTDAFKVEVSDLRNETNTGIVMQRASYDDDDDPSTPVVFTEVETELKGEVVSGILFKPKAASKDNKRPAVVLTHGYLNNRELQLPFAIELARRGFVVLTVDREGHGNYNNVDNANALMATKGLYESAKYVYNLDYVDKERIGISGHSMGGYTTMMALYQDSIDMPSGTAKIEGKTATTYGLGIISAGLIQGWSTFITAGHDVSVGLLKANDDEFFFNSTDSNGEATIARQFLNSTGAANFVGVKYEKGQEINVENGGHYVNGSLVNVEFGTALETPFRAIYEANEIHPLNHWSIPSTAHLLDFFYTAFGTPTGVKTKAAGNQSWWVKEMFSFLGMLALLSLIFPAISLLLTAPVFESLKKRRRKIVNSDGTVLVREEAVTQEVIDSSRGTLKGWQDYLYYFIPAIACTLFSGFIIKDICTVYGDRWFPNTQLYPQDTTNWVALWTLICGVFAGLVILVTYLVKWGANKVRVQLNKETREISNPYETMRISSFGNALKTIALAFLIVFALYLIVFVNWAIFKVDFRLWTLTIKVFNVPEMLPTALRYLPFFLVFYILNGVANQTYRLKNLPEWSTIIINAFFNIFGILLVMLIQYGTFKSTGVLWQKEMNLGYIVLFPIISILIFATIISRLLFKKTGNVYLGSLINALLFTMITVSSTASSFAYVLG